MHRGQLAEVRFSYVDVEGLALVDVSSPVCCHVYQCFLREFPHSLVQPLQVIRNALNSLHKIKI